MRYQKGKGQLTLSTAGAVIGTFSNGKPTVKTKHGFVRWALKESYQMAQTFEGSGFMYDRYFYTSCSPGYKWLKTTSRVNNLKFAVSDLLFAVSDLNWLWMVLICCESRFWIFVNDLNLLWAFAFDVTVVGHRTRINKIKLKSPIKWLFRNNLRYKN